MPRHRATEGLGVEEADRLFPETQAWVDSILARLRPHLTATAPLRVLDVGAAQGRTVIALQQRGHQAVGVEPWAEAIAASRALAERHGTTVEIREGAAEQLPFGDQEFDLVIAMSVLEHVDDLPQTLREVFRVLRPGGIFWFATASSLSPRQDEIAGFPLFGWYPLPLKRRIMAWAATQKPALVGHTEKPAVNWFTPWSTRRELRAAGFDQVWDRWELRVPDDGSGPSRTAALAAKRFPLLRIAGDVVVPGCSYAARKPADSAS